MKYEKTLLILVVVANFFILLINAILICSSSRMNELRLNQLLHQNEALVKKINLVNGRKLSNSGQMQVLGNMEVK